MSGNVSDSKHWRLDVRMREKSLFKYGVNWTVNAVTINGSEEMIRGKEHKLLLFNLVHDMMQIFTADLYIQTLKISPEWFIPPSLVQNVSLSLLQKYVPSRKMFTIYGNLGAYLYFMSVAVQSRVI